MLDHIKLQNILFLDIETVPMYPAYEDLPGHLKPLWDHKASFLIKDDQTSSGIYERAGIYAEFGKIICISTGILNKEKEGHHTFRIKSFAGDNEAELLKDFSGLLNTHFSHPRFLLCAHNGKEFDFPYIARRMLVNNLKLPKILNIAGKKPWEVPHIDTMELWKFGDYKHFSSLNLLAAIFNIPGPKDDISGKDVAKVYYREKNLSRIVEYCQKDVLTVAQVLLKYRGENLVAEDAVTVV
jgi:3'-5' exonuclease